MAWLVSKMNILLFLLFLELISSQNIRLPQFPNEYDYLSPHLSSKTIENHYNIYEASLTDELNILLSKLRKDEEMKPLVKKGIDYMLENLNDIKNEYRNSVRYFGGSYINHEFMWEILDHNHSEMSEELNNAIISDFGSFDGLIKEVLKKTNLLHGSGWIWLCLGYDNKLSVELLLNEDNPTMFGYRGILGIDLWEHAYFNDYPMKRGEYIENYLDCINWEVVNRKYKEGKEYFEKHKEEYQNKMKNKYYESISRYEEEL